jgi:hypothetical protein
MARKALPIGPHTLHLIEDARIDLLREALAVRDGENEPVFDLPHEGPDLKDEDTVDGFRRQISKVLAEFDPDELRPAEQRCRRINSLADGKGITSLTTIVDQQFDNEQSQEFEDQPDPPCEASGRF